jgi:hypothetical protein
MSAFAIAIFVGAAVLLYYRNYMNSLYADPNLGSGGVEFKTQMIADLKSRCSEGDMAACKQIGLVDNTIDITGAPL